MSFESVKNTGPMWECKQTGKKSDDTLKALKPTGKSFIVGYYLGSEEIDSPGGGKSVVHRLKMEEVGDESHIVGDLGDNKEVSMWGTGVLNDNLAKVGIGQLCKIVWEGKAKPKGNGNPYHTWDVLVDKTAEPYKPDNGSVAAAPQQEPAQASPAAAAPVATEDEDDDMPF